LLLKLYPFSLFSTFSLLLAPPLKPRVELFLFFFSLLLCFYHFFSHFCWLLLIVGFLILAEVSRPFSIFLAICQLLGLGPLIFEGLFVLNSFFSSFPRLWAFVQQQLGGFWERQLFYVGPRQF
jgi:hypothetical protein